MKKIRRALLSAAALLAATGAHAGPYIFAGTDADDHGSASATANLDGWKFMQRALENIATSTSLTTTNRVVVALGTDPLTQAGNAALSAFEKSSLPGAGWTFVDVADLTSANFSASIAGAGIIMLDSSGDNVGGGRSSFEESVLTSNAAALNSFVGGGGGLFSQAGQYGWLSALVPGLTVNPLQDQGLTLTAAGSSAFPGLTNADLSAGPYHQNFTSIGAISVFATGEAGLLDVVIGSAGGSITAPDPMPMPVPEPSTYVMMALGLAATSWVAKRRRKDDQA